MLQKLIVGDEDSLKVDQSWLKHVPVNFRKIKINLKNSSTYMQSQSCNLSKYTMQNGFVLSWSCIEIGYFVAFLEINYAESSISKIGNCVVKHVQVIGAVDAL